MAEAEVPVRNPTTGEIRMVPREGVEAFTKQTGWHVSTAEQREVAAENLESGGTGQQALAAGEQAVRTGTLGAVPGFEGWQQREKVLRRESPVISGLAQGAGAIAPAVLTGGIASGLAGAVGLGARGAALAAAAGEGLAGGLAEEVEQARYETRDVSLGNVMLYGLGGELVGRALPHAFALGAGRVKRALTGAEAAAGDGLTDALVGAEERAVRSQADLAHELPKGSAERAEALRSTAPQQYDRMGTEAAKDLDQIADLTSKMGDTSSSSKVVGRIKESLPEDSPAQTEFFTSMKSGLNQARDDLRASVAEAGPKGLGKRVDSVIDGGLRKLDKTTDTAEQYLIARDIKKGLQQVSSDLVDIPEAKRGPLFDQARQQLDDTWQRVNEGLKDRSLFGAAADIEADISGPFTEKVLRARQTIGGELQKGAQFDPAKLRSFLKGDAVDRQLTGGQIDQLLEGAEELAAAHERHGTWNPDQVKQLRDAVARVRDKSSLADELQAAANAPRDKTPGPAEKSLGQQAADSVKGYAVSRAAGAAGAAAGGLIGGPVGAALGWGVGEVASAIGKRLVGIDAAGRNATKQAARNLAGVGMGYAQRVAGEVSRGAAGAAVAAGAMTAIARFQGDYPDAQASFEAKRKVLDQHQIQPEVLYETLGSALGDLPKVRPDLFQAIAQRTGEKIRFIRENLPAGLQTSLLYPNGTPPSQSDLRDFATLWNTVMDPETVLHDLNAGTATQQQMQTLKKSDRELYDQLRGDIIEMVGTHFKDVPTSTKVSLDLLLEADGMAGPIFSSAAARYIGEATKTAQEQEQRMPPPPTSNAPPSATPAGINAIQTSVTNRQAA